MLLVTASDIADTPLKDYARLFAKDDRPKIRHDFIDIAKILLNQLSISKRIISFSVLNAKVFSNSIVTIGYASDDPLLLYKIEKNIYDLDNEPQPKEISKSGIAFMLLD